MASSKSLTCPFAPFDSPIFNVPSNASSYEILLDALPDFGEGILFQRHFGHVISWEVLFLLRSTVKEGLAQASLLNCPCSILNVPGNSTFFLCSASSSATTDSFSRQLLSEGNLSTLGCHCSRPKEVSIGALTCHDRKEFESLQQDFSFIGSVFNNLSHLSWCRSHCCGQDFFSIGSVLNKLSSLNFHSHSRGKGHQHPHIQEMLHGRDNVGLADLKVNIQRLYEMVAIGIMDSRETAKEVKTLVDVVGYTSYQIINHDARIDDNEMNLKEIMGKVDRIQEDLQRMVQLNQGSQAHENPVGAVQNMMEESVTQPMGQPGNP